MQGKGVADKKLALTAIIRVNGCDQHALPIAAEIFQCQDAIGGKQVTSRRISVRRRCVNKSDAECLWCRLRRADHESDHFVFARADESSRLWIVHKSAERRVIRLRVAC